MLTVKRILVPTDFSETSEAAIGYAAELAKTFDASLHVLHVVERTLPSEGAEFPLNLEDEMKDAARKRLIAVLPEGKFHGVGRPEFSLRVGGPAIEIVKYAADNSIDLIVMGTNGRGFVSHMLMGSVAEKVVRRAPCPVLTIRHPEYVFVAPAETDEALQVIW